MVNQIIVRWYGPGAGDKVSVLNFADGGSVTAAEQREAVFNFLDVYRAFQWSATRWEIDETVRVLDATTGALNSITVDPIAMTATGSGTPPVVADASQVLLRLNTEQVINGRQVRGRVFLPFMSSSNLSDGNVAAAMRSTLGGAAEAELLPAGITVWHRPVAGAGGQTVTPASAEVWAEMAVLRRRRG